MASNVIITQETVDSTVNDDDDDAADDPHFSSAALCIEFKMLGQSFRPVFTHQIFSGEWIRGYRPFRERLDAANMKKSHSSFQNHDKKASLELLVTVNLAPSCDMCTMETKTRTMRQGLPVARRSKRPRLATTEEDENDDVEDDESFEDNDEENGPGDDDDEYEVSADADGGAEQVELDDGKEGSTRLARMPLSDVRKSMEKALPRILDALPDKAACDDCFLRNPVGRTIMEYQRHGMDFVLTLATGKEASVFHSHAQKLAIWFIETADEIDIADESDGYWKVLYLFHKHKRLQYSFAGYMTLFHFRSPFHKPQPGIILRIAQALLLPPYQRMGHGRTMMHQVFDHVAATKTTAADYAMGLSAIVQVNVEDPAPEFTQLRNRVDYERFLQAKNGNDNNWLGVFGTMATDDKRFFDALPESVIAEAACRAKITKQQIHIIFELHRLQQLTRDKRLLKRSFGNEDLEKRFRLMVKSRLNKLHAEDMSTCRSKEEKQKLLAKLFEDVFQQYQAIIASIEKVKEQP